jgi:dTMP kinase
MFAADRLDHQINEIQPALDAGVNVISDRYYLSSYAYQSLQSDLSWVRQLNSRCQAPHLTVLLDAAPELCLQRMKKERHGHERYEKLEQLHKVRRNYLDIAAALSSEGENVVKLDAALSIDDIHERIRAEVNKLT